MTIDELIKLDSDSFTEFMNENVTCELHYGLPIVEFDGEQYAIAYIEEKADKACGEYIENTIWAFDPYFLEQMTDVPAEMFEAVQYKCDSINEALQILVMRTCGMDDFVDAAINADGRGHFLSPYDGEEIELACGGYAYRID